MQASGNISWIAQASFHVDPTPDIFINILLFRLNRADLLINSLTLRISVTDTPRSKMFPLYAKAFFLAYAGHIRAYLHRMHPGKM